MKYQDWLLNWMEICVKPTVKLRTCEKYDYVINKQIAPALGGIELKDLSATTLQSFIAELPQKYSPSTVSGILAVMRCSLHQAVNMGIVDRQYIDCVKAPKIKEKKIECFSLEEQHKIEKYIFLSKKKKLFGIVLCFYTGLRIGELLALSWDDLDLNEGILRVSKSCRDTWKNGKYIKEINTPKTETSIRDIPLPKQLIPYLRKMKKEGDGDYIFGNLSVRSYQMTFELLLKKLKIPHKGFHAIRHTFATRALECGMDVKTLAEILGHQNPTITLKRYAHSMFDHKSAMMNKIGKLLT